ncbi:hypothetical protein MN116_003180 [Schistosoma mekongi]|uniref:Ras GTPase-activating protein n=1 Tax=Schistosoma mekongi TaxID=38744 RepID=A0AAE1ZHR1_SCHME|nr:hypothetical protein MN116_003180 [Schistosoma mekongi]
MEQEIKCTHNRLCDDTTEVTTDDSMTSSHYCFGLRMKSHDIHEGKSKSLSRNHLGSSTSISMPLAWPKRVGSRKKSNTCIEFEENSEYAIKKQSLTDVTNNDKCRKETDTHKERFLRFFRIGFTNKSKKQKTDIINIETSPFDAIRNVSAKHSHFAKYLELENSVNQSLTYLPSTVKMSLQWPEQETSDTFDLNETQKLPLYPTKGINSEEDSYKNICTNVMIRPPKCGQRSSSVVQSDRFSEISTDKNIDSYSISEKFNPPTPVTSKSTALLRRPRTPTLGRAALFVRASYMGVDKPGTPSSLSICKQSTRRDTIASNDSRLFDFPNLSSAQSGFISRSSSINCELKELNQNSQQSFNQLSIQNNSSQSNLQGCTSNGRQNETKIPIAIPNRHHCHAYDTVPLDKLECLKLIPSVQMLNKGSEANSELPNLTLLKSSSRVPAAISCLNGCQKLPSTDFCTKQNEVDKIKTDVWKDTKHSDNMSIISSSETETSLQNHKRSVKCPMTLMKGESNRTFEVTSLQQDSQSSSKSCDNILSSRKLVEIPKASVQPIRQKSGKTNVGADLPTSPKSRNPQKSSHSFYLKQNKNSEKKCCDSTNITESNTEITINKQSLECTKQSQNEKQINHSINIGSIVLRRRAKPELENEQHRDVSLRISIQEVKNLSAKGRYFCEICLDRTLYARTTSKLSDGTVFWGEQFDLNNLPSISIVTINLFRQETFVKDKRQRNKNQNQFIAYVTIPLNDDLKQCEVQKWFTMQPPQFNLNINYLESLQSHYQQPQQQQNDINQTSSIGGSGRFRKHSTPASCFGYSASFSVIPTSQYSNNKLNGDEFKINHVDHPSKKKSSWTAGVNTDVNLNKTSKTVPKISPTTTPTSPSLSPNSNSVTTNFILPENSLPQLRMKIQYQTVDILPIICYDDLKEFIKTKYLDLIKCLEIKLSAKQKEELASCLVNIFEKLPDLSVAEFLADLLREDLNNNGNESMIFRANSTGSKAMECYIKLVGNDYLQYILGSIIDQLLVTGDEFEIDPSRLGTSSDSSNASNNRNLSSAILERNRAALLKYVAMIWQRIEANQCKLPKELREVFITLASIVEDTHGVQSAAHLVSSCLFLRFICPAIHGPVLFGLASSIPENNRISRNLTLLAKVLQNLANLTLFEDKELHMKMLNSFVEQEIPVMYRFLRSIASNTDANYHLSTNSDCHQFIELGYEFAKLTQLLNLYVGKISITPRIAELPSLLQNITELLNNQTFAPWSQKSPANFDKNTNIVHSHFDSSRSGIPRHHSFGVNNPVSDVDVRRQSETSNRTKPPMTNLQEVNKKLSTETPIALKPERTQHEINNKCGSINSNGNSEFISSTKQEKSCDTYVVQKDYLPCKFDSGDMIFRQININDLGQSENMEALLNRYREQLRQLNDCIEKVEPNCYHTTNLSHNLSHSTQSVHKTGDLSDKEVLNKNIHTNMNKNQIKNERINKSLLRQNISENGCHQTKRKIINSKSDKSTPIELDHVVKKAQCSDQKTDDEITDNLTIQDDDDYINECDIGRILMPTHSAYITNNHVSTSDSDYDYDNDDENDQTTDCTAEETSECKIKLASKQNRSRKLSKTRQNQLSESPSLDQLAEKLQELKKMLQLERQEIEEVVASKTEVIKQQEKSIEQLESELDQLRREHKPSKVKPPNGRHTSKSTSRTVSPTSSFSSECYSSNLSDVTQACHSYYNQINNNNINNNNNNNNNSDTNNNNHFVDSPAPNHHSNQGLNSIGRCEALSLENYRTQSFREKLLWRGQMGRCEPQVRCDSNLLFLSRASEGTGIPLGHLIETNRSMHIRRRVSETKVLPH